MQRVEQNHHNQIHSAEAGHKLAISWEWIAYLVLFLIITTFWLSDIDRVPLNDTEAVSALASWHALEDTAGDAILPDSPILFNWHMVNYAFLGVNEFAVRLPGFFALLALLAFSAAGLRTILGKERALVMTGLLAFSPLIFLSSRSADPMLWALVFALIWLWSLYQHWYTRHPQYLTIASFAIAGFLFLSAPGAPLAFLMIVLAAILAFYWVLFTASDEIQIPAEEITATIRAWLQSWQWSRLIAITLAIVFVFATVFMVYPSGLGHVSQLFAKTLTPFTGASSPLLAVLTYDLLLILLAFVAVFIAMYRIEFGFIERFATIWLILALFASWMINGFGSSITLWVLPPGIYLVSYLVMICIAPMADDTYRFVGFLDQETYYQRYWWVKWSVAIVVASLVLMASFHWQEMTRGLLLLPLDTELSAVFGLLAESLFIQFRYSAIWLTISLLFLFVGFFLAASLWGSRNVWQGYGIGIIAFAVLSGFGGGYNAAITPERFAEIWHPTSTETDYTLLRQTLIEIAQRDTSGFYEIPVTIVTDDLDTIDPLLMWAVRDFTSIRYTVHVEDAAQEQIIILPQSERPPELGGSYVGQSFVIRTRWSLDQIVPFDTFAWLSQRVVRPQAYTQDYVILWLRQDVFEGVPLFERP